MPGGRGRKGPGAGGGGCRWVFAFLSGVTGRGGRDEEKGGSQPYLGPRGAGRVVAELGQDVAGLPDDLAGFGQGGALSVFAVGDGGVVAVAGGRGAGAGLP